jgi:hypothetical protein
MGEVPCVLAALAFSARLVVGSAEQELAEPQGKPLFANTPRAM